MSDKASASGPDETTAAAPSAALGVATCGESAEVAGGESCGRDITAGGTVAVEVGVGSATPRGRSSPTVSAIGGDGFGASP
ncbi:hypothetical protein, partial [Nocardia testacea]|uniref:hypothetical protein n=1 Tax=Nocardia testacea TaxID=248551 RepID=UPI001C3F4792